MRQLRYLRAAETHLAAAHPVLARLVERVGRCTLKAGGDPFEGLVRIVIGQQISTRAADAIENRVNGFFAKAGLSPKAVLQAGDADLRGCGLSEAKVRTIRAVAQRVLSGEIALSTGRLTDAAIAEQLMPTHGIGPWSVDMYLMFGLGRPDVLPVGDFGLRAAVRDAFSLRSLPDAKKLTRLAEPWRPYRTVASWYLWRSRGPVPQS